MKPKTLRISRGGGARSEGVAMETRRRGVQRCVGGRYAAVERPGELAALRAAGALSHRGGRPKKRGGTRCRGSRAQASPNPGGSPFLAGSGMESLLPRYLKAPTGRLPAGTRAVGGTAQDPESAMSNHSTPPFDPRFPTQNQTRNCYQNFLGHFSKPSLRGAPSTVVSAGDTVTLLCQASPTYHNPKFTFSLLKAGVPHPVQRQSPEGDEANFTLPSVKAEDAGSYSCICSVEGRASSPSDDLHLEVAGARRALEIPPPPFPPYVGLVGGAWMIK
ncbi:uncharacterized protein LOC130458841 [Monodelphis domestica]|uniref:uncharacterized protein LOC130458841 n=1 Tax=Monodelphis domestica TaxID=13616 RepID=UPI0024E1FDA4|nr:uncharacterized protein LOC130458841 [Monodelphis domestica]